MTELIRGLLSMTTWEMEVPTAYGPLHLPFFLIGTLLSIFLAWKLRNASDKVNRGLLLTLGIVLVLGEVYKQLLYELVLEPDDGYNWKNFSFQMCSIPMYLCLILPFMKPGKVARGMYCFLMTYNLLGGFISLVAPTGLFHGYWTLTLHAMIWHMLLVFLGLYVAFSGRGCRDRKDFKWATVTYLVLCVLAFIFNCAFWDLSGGQLNLFYVGPKNSTLPVFSIIANALGWYVNTALFIPVTVLGSFVIYLLLRSVKNKWLSPVMTK